MFVSTYSKENAKSQAKVNTQLLLRTVLRILKLKIDAPTEGVGGGGGSQVQKISRTLTVNRT
jgi:hypothetical protein